MRIDRCVHALKKLPAITALVQHLQNQAGIFRQINKIHLFRKFYARYLSAILYYIGEFLNLFLLEKILDLSIAEFVLRFLIEQSEQSACKQHQYQNIKAYISRSVALRFQLITSF